MLCRSANRNASICGRSFIAGIVEELHQRSQVFHSSLCIRQFYCAIYFVKSFEKVNTMTSDLFTIFFNIEKIPTAHMKKSNPQKRSISSYLHSIDKVLLRYDARHKRFILCLLFAFLLLLFFLMLSTQKKNIFFPSY